MYIRLHRRIFDMYTIYVHTCVYTSTSTYAYKSIPWYTYMHIYTCTHFPLCTCAHVRMSTHLQLCIYTCQCADVSNTAMYMSVDVRM